MTRSDGVAEAARRVMLDRLDQRLTVAEVAREFNYSTFWFRNLFAREVGVTPGRYLAALRIERARELLRDGDLPVSAVAHRVGFRSVTAFSTAFHRVEGVPPTAYRRRASRRGTTDR